jgi:hypothetical protein
MSTHKTTLELFSLLTDQQDEAIKINAIKELIETNQESLRNATEAYKAIKNERYVIMERIIPLFEDKDFNVRKAAIAGVKELLRD